MKRDCWASVRVCSLVLLRIDRQQQHNMDSLSCICSPLKGNVFKLATAKIR